jgi:hypothetical protein
MVTKERVTVKTIKVSEFKAKCLRPMDETKNGRPVAQLGPVVSRPPTMAGSPRGAITILGDIVAPLGEDWAAAR